MFINNKGGAYVLIPCNDGKLLIVLEASTPALRENERRNCIKRSVKYATVAALVIALFIFSIQRQLPSEDQQRSRIKCPQYHSKTVKTIKEMGCRLELTSPAFVSCSQLVMESSLNDLLGTLKEVKDKNISEAKLTLVDTQFQDGELKMNWLPITSEHPDIIALSISGGNLKEIGNDSFNTIQNLESLTIENAKIITLNREGFKGLKQITEFALRANYLLTSVEYGLLQEFSVSSIQIQDLDVSAVGENFFDNLTGENTLRFEAILDLQFCNIPIFPSNILSRTPRLQSLYLQQSNIQDFEPTVFDFLPNLRQVFLENNAIETFFEDIFGPIIRRNVTVYAANNPIRCDCNMLWLQEFIIHEWNRNYTDFASIKCNTPENFKDKNFLDVNLCPENFTVTTESPTTENDYCTSLKSGEFEIKITDLFQSSQSKISVSEDSSGNHTITLENAISPTVLVWFKSSVNYLQCDISEQASHNLKLSFDENYIFCVFDFNQLEAGDVKLMDCIPYKTQPEFSARTWLSEGDKVVTLTSFSISGALALIFGALSMYCLIRRRPTLLRGSGRVEIVKTRDKEMVLVMPQQFKAVPASPNSDYDTISGHIAAPHFPSNKTNPPPVPPYPSHWLRRNKKEEHVYLEPYHNHFGGSLPGNVDLLLEYEWYTQRQQKVPNVT